MQLAPAIVDVILVDSAGVEKLHVSRVEPDVIGSGVDRSNDEAVLGAFSQRVWYGPVAAALNRRLVLQRNGADLPPAEVKGT